MQEFINRLMFAISNENKLDYYSDFLIWIVKKNK